METVYTSKIEKGVQCLLCPHLCKLREGEWGKCGARVNKDDKVIARNYEQVAALALDPIEKKPLYHFYPGTNILSVGTFGCNFKCAFCQNWQLAHGGEKGELISPAKLVGIAKAKAMQQEGNIGIAYTYSEPLMWYEYILDAAEEAKKFALKNVLVSNGFINPNPLAELLPYLDGANIDIKSFNPDFYNGIVGGDLKVVLNNTARFKKAGVHVELTYLLVTSLNDSYQETKAMVKWIKEEVGSDTPLHISRYFPNYKLDLPPTPMESLLQSYEAAKEELSYVYLGNVSCEKGQDTICPSCGQILIKRNAYNTDIIALENGRCKKCHAQIPGIFA